MSPTKRQIVSTTKSNKSRKNNFVEKNPGPTTVNQKSSMVKPRQSNSANQPKNSRKPSHQVKDDKQNRVQNNNNKDDKDTKQKESGKLEIQKVLGGRFIDRPVVFSMDSK